MSNVGWHVTQKFVILVPDPIAFADQRWSTQASLATSVRTLLSGLPLRGLLSHHGTKTTWAMAFPRINCRTTTATVLTATATVTLSLRVCLCLCYTPITSPSAAEAAQRLRLDEEQEEQGQERLALYTSWISQDSHVPWSSRGGTRVSSGLTAPQMSRRSRARRAGPREARFVISQDSHIDFVLFVVVFLFPCEQAIIAAAGRRLWRRRESNAAGTHVLFNFMSCPPRLSQGLFFGMHVNSFFFSLLAFTRSYCHPRHAMACSFRTLSQRIRQEVMLQCSRRHVSTL